MGEGYVVCKIECPDPQAITSRLFPQYWDRSPNRNQHLSERMSPAQLEYMFEFLDRVPNHGNPETTGQMWSQYFGVSSIRSALTASIHGRGLQEQFHEEKGLPNLNCTLQRTAVSCDNQNIPCDFSSVPATKRCFSEVLHDNHHQRSAKVCNPTQFLPLLCPADISRICSFQKSQVKILRKDRQPK